MNKSGPVSTAELVDNVEGYLHGRSISPDEYESVKHSVAELSLIFSNDVAYFVLGSYGRPEIYRLQLVKDRLNRRESAYAFLMVDVRSEWTNTYLKFRLLADYTDYIVGVAEHDRGGFLVEQGYFTVLEAYFVKTYVLKREYETLAPGDVDTDADISSPYSEMQKDVFRMLEDGRRLCVWVDEDGLVDCADRLPP